MCKKTPSCPSRFLKWLPLVLSPVIFLLYIPCIHARDFVTSHDHGRINWTTGQITVSGNATPSGNTAKEIESLPGSARADANRNLIRLLKQIHLFHDLSVGQYASVNDKILGGIEKTARDAATTLQTYTSAMDLRVLVSMNFHGPFLQLILPEDICQISGVTLETDQGDKKKTHDGSSMHTGLIIDAGSVMSQPVLYPVVIDENGSEIYSSRFISREFAVQFGVCSYACDMDTAMEQEHVGTAPVVVKALRASGTRETFLVISTAEAKKLEKITERHRFLRECRVVIICKVPQLS